MQDTIEPLFTLAGRVEARRCLPPESGLPRMEISFSGDVSSGCLEAGSGACTFVAAASPGGTYAMQGFGTLFLPAGFVQFELTGAGERSTGAIVYEGFMRLRGLALPASLGAGHAAFRYRQDLASLAVRLQCGAWPALRFSSHLPENSSC